MFNGVLQPTARHLPSFTRPCPYTPAEGMIKWNVPFRKYMRGAGCIGVRRDVGAVPSAWRVQRVFGWIEVIWGALKVRCQPIV